MKAHSCAFDWTRALQHQSRSAADASPSAEDLFFSFPLWAAGTRAACASPRARVRRFSFFCLHSFTHRAQYISAQRNRGEGFYPSAFTRLFIGDRESTVPPLLLLNTHKCSLMILYASAAVSEDQGEGKMPFWPKAFTPNAMIHCKMQEMGEEVKAKNEK